jgi:hypothetical protein
VTVEISPTALTAQFAASGIVAVPVLLDPMVTVPEGYHGQIVRIRGDVNVASFSPSGPGYQIRIAIDGVWRSVIDATFAEFLGLVPFDFAIEPPIDVDTLSTVEVRIEPDYAPTGIVNWNDAVAYLEFELIPYAPACDPTEPISSGLNESDFMAILKSSADSAYIDPIVEAGEGNGLEVYTQAIAQFVRTSEAIERSTQAMFVREASGQTGPQARGGKKACVPLLFERSLASDRTLIFDTSIRIGELETDAGETGGEEVLVERFYKLESPLVYNPGESGDKYARGLAEQFGYGYNNPREDTLRYIVQPGAGQHNRQANVSLSHHGDVSIVCFPAPDVFGPHLVGQYVQMTAGANIGRMARITSYHTPDSALPPGGGSVAIERLFVVRCRVFGPRAFAPGEYVYQPVTGAHGTVLRQSNVEPYAILSIRVDGSEAFLVGAGCSIVSLDGIFGILDPTVYPDTVILEQFTDWVSEPSRTASWRIVPWSDLGIIVTNTARPSGGRAGFLDALGHERNVNRLSGESDDSYRARIIAMADTVSPMAIRRAILRILDPLGMHADLLEVGTLALPGFFFDVEANRAPEYSFAYDTYRDEDRWKTYLSLYEMRAFFIVEFAPASLGDFGFSYDSYPWGAFDASPYTAFFDGYGWISAQARRQLWQDIDRRRAGGVAFDFVEHIVPVIPLP